MKLNELRAVVEQYPTTFPRFVLPDGDHIPEHAHVTEVGHVAKNYIDCGGMTGSEEHVVLQTHVGNDTEHRLRADQLAKILALGKRVLPHEDLPVAIEYDCCVVSQYPVSEVRVSGERLDIILGRSATQCRARERAKAERSDACCATAPACC